MRAAFYVNRIEGHFEDPVELERLRWEDALEEEDRRAIDERVGTYLADLDRGSEPLQVGGPRRLGRPAVRRRRGR